ncbi:acyl-CoA dehydrogenase family protein [Amycolatopsis acidicola]|uniref:acyl-CoA dehydrogenase family protein n=1 Tax=Amycolatopsis acidicola TaxID=2596893 RepID=UPI00140B0A3E|nr:acyl-CoA dehydrogenase family protein [Amycolatopsis acidicola]
MDFDLSREQRDLSAAVRAFTTAHAGLRPDSDASSGQQAKAWAAVREQLGVHGLLIPEPLGGAGGTILDLVVVLQEFGRELFCSPYLASAGLATVTLLGLPQTEARDRVLRELGAGEVVATAGRDIFSDHRAVTGRPTAEVEDARWSLTGTSEAMIEAELAGVALVVANTVDGPGIFAVRLDASGVSRQRLVTLDPTRSLTTIRFDRVAADLLCSGGELVPLLPGIRAQAMVLLAAEQVGGASRCLEMAVEHAVARRQFGRPIGAFQAIKHLCADMLVDAETADAAVRVAAWNVDEQAEDVRETASMAALQASAAFYRTAARTIQVHGAIAYTWEHPAHLYYKRAVTSRRLLASPSALADEIAARTGLGVL